MGAVLQLSEARRVVADVENGFTRTANEIQDMMCRADLSGAQFRVLNAVIRLTYGYNKPSDRVTNTYLQELTGLSERSVRTALTSLEERHILVVEKVGGMKQVSINKVISDWQLDTGKSAQMRRKSSEKTVQMCRATGTNAPKNRIKCANTKDKRQLTKDKDISRDESRPHPKRDELTTQAFRVITYLNEQLGNRYPLKADGNVCKGIRARLSEGFTVEELQQVVDFKQAEWGNHPTMSQYLRPSTLFRPSHCQGYLQAANTWHKQGRPLLTDRKQLINSAQTNHGGDIMRGALVNPEEL